MFDSLRSLQIPGREVIGGNLKLGEMAFDPDCGAECRASSAQCAAGGKTQPAPATQEIRSNIRFSSQQQQLTSVRKRVKHAHARRPRLNLNGLPGISMEKLGAHPGACRIRALLDCCNVSVNGTKIQRIELLELDEDDRALSRAWCVMAARWVAHIPTDSVVALLVLEDTFQHQVLFPASMSMRGKG